MKSVAVFNNKGGVGKTTLLCNLAAYLALKRRKRVLVVDADPQCNASSYIIPETTLVDVLESKKGTINDFFGPLEKGKGYYTENLPIYKSSRFGVDVILGDPRLALQEDLLAEDWSAATNGKYRGLQTTMVFRQLFGRCQDYDFVFVDMGPSLGAINRAVLIGCDHFVVPMSSDIFSLQAIENITVSLKRWKQQLLAGLKRHLTEDGEAFDVNGVPATWTLGFLGYVTQQYQAKKKQGVRRAVNSYERIIRKIPSLIERNLVADFGSGKDLMYELGQVQNLHSLVPMSQEAKTPIFTLKGGDGVVGAHFTKVKDAESIFGNVADQFLKNSKLSV